MEKKTFMVTSLDAGQRIDKFLKKMMPAAPLSLIYKLLRTKDVKVNNTRIKEDYILEIDDSVTIFLTEAQASEFLTPYVFAEVEKDFDVLYEDDQILVTHKKSGLLVHSTQNEKIETLANMVLTYLFRKGEFDPTARGYIPSPVARIDQDTDGVVIFSKKQVTHQVLANAFTNESMVRRAYRLVVYGIVKPDVGIINFPLIKENGIVKVDTKGHVASTRYQVLKYGKDKTYLEAILLTGRQHQIRVHFQNLGHPILGDQKYGKKGDGYPFALNAYALTFMNLEFPLDYLNEKTFIADNTKELMTLIGG